MFAYSDKIKTHLLLDNLENKLKRKSSCRSGKISRSGDDKRTRREVANNNERRRMQSINAGFENLKKLLPLCNDMEKISKATILQTTAKYIGDLQLKINSLENDMARLRNLEKMISNEKTILIESLQSNEEMKLNTNERKDDTESSVSEPGSSLSLSMTDNLSSRLISYSSEEEILNQKSMSICRSINISEGDDEQTDFSPQQNNLEQLLAAVEQVERLEAQQTISLNKDLTRSTNKITKSESMLYSIASSCSRSSSDVTTTTNHLIVMKPTISPFAEKIIQDVVNMHHHQQPYNKLVTSINATNGLIFSQNCSITTMAPVTKNSQKSFISNTFLQRNDILSQNNH